MHLRRFIVDATSHGAPVSEASIRAVLTTTDWFPSDNIIVQMVDEDERREPTWANDTHILYAGWIMGMAIRHGLDVAPVCDEEGIVTPRLQIHLPGRSDMETIRVELVIPPPPPDWKMYA